MALAPYSHPTTVCVVDDNESFVDSLSFELPSDWACQTFTDPFAARDYINTKPALPALADRCMSADLTSTHPTIHHDLSKKTTTSSLNFDIEAVKLEHSRRAWPGSASPQQVRE